VRSSKGHVNERDGFDSAFLKECATGVYPDRCSDSLYRWPELVLRLPRNMRCALHSAQAKATKLDALQAKRAAKVLVDEGWLKQEVQRNPNSR
jgi:hypothetical protein